MDGSPGDEFLGFSTGQRAQWWAQAVAAVEDYLQNTETLRLLPLPDAAVRERLAAWTFEEARPDALGFVLDGMRQGQLHTAHPCYFGVFNPRPSTGGILGDLLAAGFNTQLASYTSAPFAIEVEQHVIRALGTLFGYPPATVEGSFTSGGAEANHTALLLALTRHFPTFHTDGVRSLPSAPALYVSSESHHSFLKAARLCGLGSGAVREIPVTGTCAMDMAALRQQIRLDRQSGLAPFFVVATAGSTSGGLVDPIAGMTSIARDENLWLHLDAAWGGAAILLPELGALFEGSAATDSFTLDAHKWFSVPMTAGLIVTRHRGILEDTFRVDRSFYMPPDSAGHAFVQPYAQSMQWSRRFIGLKVFLSLALAGWDGYRQTLRHQVRMGDYLRQQLALHGWRVVNETLLPVVCFVDAHRPMSDTDVETLAARVGGTGRTWITTTRLGTVPTLRAGIANFSTQERHIDTLIEVLDQQRLPP